MFLSWDEGDVTTRYSAFGSVLFNIFITASYERYTFKFVGYIVVRILPVIREI